MPTLEFPYDFCSLAYASVVLALAFYAAGHAYRWSHHRTDAARPQSDAPIIGLVLAGAAAALAGVLVTATGTLDTSELQHGIVTKHCEMSPQTHLLAYVQSQPGDIDPQERDFHIRREDLFMAGLGKLSEYHGYFEGLIGLAAVAVGVLIVAVARFLFATENSAIYSVMPRAAAAVALAAISFVALIASHHLLFIIVNGQLALLGSGHGYCYANFALVYTKSVLDDRLCRHGGHRRSADAA